MAGLEDWLARGDLDELLRECDRLCERRDWDRLVRLRDGARAAFDRGHQLWPAAAHAEYRLALEAPAEWAVPAVESASGQFTLGPLTEVVASTHRWAELRPHVTDGRVGALIAHERVIRGDEVDPADGIDPTVLDLPMEVGGWEPTYATATYHAHRVETPRPALPPPGRLVPLPDPGLRVDDPDTISALHDLAATWADDSNGRVEVAAVEGDAASAVASLGPGQAALTRLPAATAVALMGWTAASGGGHGRRRGAAAGRFGAWWAAAALTDLLDDWPVPGPELGEAVAELVWYGWSAGEPDTGWACRLAIEDPAHGLAWAIGAVDAAD
ncbi:MAG: DUF6183 family protein [Actinomycetota bacterium]